MKKTLTIFASLVFLGLFIFVLDASSHPVSAASTADEYVELTGIYGITQGVEGANADERLASLFQNTFNLLVGVAGILAVIMLVWGGVQYMASDVITDKKSAVEKMQGAVLGLLLVLFSVAILYTINPDIFSFRIFVPPVNSPSSSQTSTNQSSATTNAKALVEYKTINSSFGSTCSGVYGSRWQKVSDASCGIEGSSGRTCCGPTGAAAKGMSYFLQWETFSTQLNCWNVRVSKFATLDECKSSSEYKTAAEARGIVRVTSSCTLENSSVTMKQTASDKYCR